MQWQMIIYIHAHFDFPIKTTSSQQQWPPKHSNCQYNLSTMATYTQTKWNVPLKIMFNLMNWSFEYQICQSFQECNNELIIFDYRTCLPFQECNNGIIIWLLNPIGVLVLKRHRSLVKSEVDFWRDSCEQGMLLTCIWGYTVYNFLSKWGQKPNMAKFTNPEEPLSDQFIGAILNIFYHVLSKKQILYLVIYRWDHQGFIRVLKNLESPEILLWHFPGMESHGKRPLVLKSSGNLLNPAKKIWIVWKAVRRINIEVLGV